MQSLSYRTTREVPQIFSFNFKIVFVYLFELHWVFVAARGLSLVVESRGYSLVVVCRQPIAVASLVVEHGL